MESSPNFISKVKELIAEGDLETAIQELLKNGYQQDKVTQLSGRYSDLLNRINEGIINSEVATLERNKIQAALLLLFLLTYPLFNQAQEVQFKGKVLHHSFQGKASENTPIAQAEVKATWASPTLTNIKSYFLFRFS